MERLLYLLEPVFSVCKLQSTEGVGLDKPFHFFARTDEELSLVCPSGQTPKGCAAREDGWRGFRIQGTLEFSLIGILAELSEILAAAKVGIYVVSTFETDYIFVKHPQLSAAKQALEAAGWRFVESSAT